MLTTDTNSEKKVSAVLLHPSDNVICLLRDHAAGERPLVSLGEANTREGPLISVNVPLGHKIAYNTILKSNGVIKYGALIGHSTQNISAGEHVHLHNLVGHVHGSVSG